MFAAGGAALRGQLEKAIVASAGLGIQIGAEKITSTKMLPDSILDSAVQNAYSWLKNVVQAV